MTTNPDAAGTPGPSPANEVLLRGRVSTGPEPRVLPSGTTIVSLRLSVPRSRTAMTKGSKQTSDWVDCVAWGSRARRSVGSWGVGDEVEVGGSLRRRFYRTPQGGATRLEVEVLSARMLVRAVRRAPARASGHPAAAPAQGRRDP